MSLTITNIENVKNAKEKIKSAKKSYDESLKLLSHTVKFTEFSWQGKNADDFRTEVNKLINGDLENVSKELEVEINYLTKLSTVLENAEEQVKQRLNI